MAANSVEKRAKQRSFVIEEKSCKTSVLCSFVSIGKEEEKIMSFWGVVGAIIVAVLILCIL